MRPPEAHEFDTPVFQYKFLPEHPTLLSKYVSKAYTFLRTKSTKTFFSGQSRMLALQGILCNTTSSVDTVQHYVNTQVDKNFRTTMLENKKRTKPDQESTKSVEKHAKTYTKYIYP